MSFVSALAATGFPRDSWVRLLLPRRIAPILQVMTVKVHSQCCFLQVGFHGKDVHMMGIITLEDVIEKLIQDAVGQQTEG